MAGSNGGAVETDGERIDRLICSPKSAAIEDVDWLVKELLEARNQFNMAKRGQGRFYGLREAAEILESAANKDLKVRFLAGKKEQIARQINTSILKTVAARIRQYADAAEIADDAKQKPAAPAAA